MNGKIKHIVRPLVTDAAILTQEEVTAYIYPTGYTFHKIHGTFHSFGLMSNFKTDPIDFMGYDFYEFFITLYNYRFRD